MNPRITQALLSRYRLSRSRETAANVESEDFRSEIIMLAKQGAATESGALAFRLQKITQQRITRDGVVDALGMDALERILEVTPTTVSDRLAVFETTSPIWPKNSNTLRRQ